MKLAKVVKMLLLGMVIGFWLCVGVFMLLKWLTAG